MDGWFIGGAALVVLSLVCPLLPFVYVLNARHGWWTQPFESRIRVRIESASDHGLNAGRTYSRLCAQLTSHHVNRVLRDLACHPSANVRAFVQAMEAERMLAEEASRQAADALSRLFRVRRGTRRGGAE